MQAVAFESPVSAGAVSEALLARGAIGRPLAFANAVAYSPPLIISDAEVDELVEAMSAAIDDVAA
jgi:adenosylmethionine-8-amino-7-oxononanoate aminotransferase